MSEPLDPAGQLGPHPDSPGTGRPPGTRTADDAATPAAGAAAAAATTSGAATAAAAENQDPTGSGDQPSSPAPRGPAATRETRGARAPRPR
ncbi:hypothetical protein ACFXO7_36160, partial [Nocardia tengchongensis]